MGVLIEDWRRVATKAWSVRWLVLANALALAPEFVGGLNGVVDDRTMVRLVLVANIAALVSRFLKQPEKPGA